jgi:hypothetical protein
MNEIVLSKPWREFYKGLIWVMLDLNPKEFQLAYRLWQQQRKQQNGVLQSWARTLLKRMGE